MEPVTTIVALHNTLTGLIERIKDRKTAAELREIQRMIPAFQSEQLALHEKCMNLTTENANLKTENSDLKKIVVTHKEQIQQLQDECVKLRNPPPPPMPVATTEEEEKILRLVASRYPGSNASSAVAKALDQSVAWVELHSAKLRKKGFISVDQQSLETQIYRIEPSRLDYLFEKGLMK